jgi:hypothetical protein
MKESELRALEWIVGARTKIQTLLVDIQKFLSHNQEELQNNDRDKYCQAFTLIMGGAFSLWRAAFLTDDERRRQTIVRHASNFLLYLIRDNIINYPQDRGTQAWSATYYINNVNLRLLQLCTVCPQIVGEDAAQRQRIYRRAIIAGTSWVISNRKETRKMWDEAFEDLNQIFINLQTTFAAECEAPADEETKKPIAIVKKK